MKLITGIGSLLKTWLDALFPPLCILCQEPIEESAKLFCPTCWGLCSSPDPLERCPHCFTLSEGTCRACKVHPQLPFPQASVFDLGPPPLYLARNRPDLLPAFAALQWVQLDWPMPNVVIPMPGSHSFAKTFSEWIEIPFAPILQRGGCDAEAIEADQILLLIDQKRSLENVEVAISHLEETFPKKGFLLSLFPYDLSHLNSPFPGRRPLFGDAYRAPARSMDRAKVGEISPPS